MATKSKSENKGSKAFKDVIQTELERRAEESSLFAATYAKENKSIDECVNYILDRVKKSKINGYTDDEIFSMAMHYYDEDDITAPNEVKGRVIVNHTIELTEEEKEKARKDAIKEVMAVQKEKMTKRPIKTVKKETETLTLF